ncbi:hypothetical protein F5Y12DRAFT_355714 [Xylaria sp. FL1777]|nr:hypothetical protein F5Y12DRAFT_355714 [Xylaria sp. FL1777]
MAAPPQIQDLHTMVTSLLTVPALQSTEESTISSLYSYSRALSAIEDFADRVTSSPQSESPDMEIMLQTCNAYKMLCQSQISRLAAQAAEIEHETYERGASARRSPKPRGKRRGLVFNVDKGDHVVAALEALRLEEFLDEQTKEGPKQVRFTE